MSAEKVVKDVSIAAAKKTRDLFKKNLRYAGEKVITKVIKKPKKDAEFHIANFFTARQAGMMAGMHTRKGRDYLMSAKPTDLAKLGAGIGAVKGGLDYLGGEDKSLGSLVGNVGVNATAGGALGYSGGLIRNYIRGNRPRPQPANVTPITTPPPARSQTSQNLISGNTDASPSSLPSRGTLAKTDSYSNPQDIPNPTYKRDHVFDARNRIGVKTLAGRVRTSGKFIDPTSGQYRLQNAKPRPGATLLESARNTSTTVDFGAPNYNIANFGVGDMLQRLLGGKKKPKTAPKTSAPQTKPKQELSSTNIKTKFPKRTAVQSKSNPLMPKSVGSFPEYAL